MVKLTSYVSIAVCAKSVVELAKWVTFWQNALPGTTAITCDGEWQGYHEPSVQVKHWSEGLACLIDVAEKAIVYQRDAEQVAVFVEVCDRGQISAYVVDDPVEDWNFILREHRQEIYRYQ